MVLFRCGEVIFYINVCFWYILFYCILFIKSFESYLRGMGGIFDCN